MLIGVVSSLGSDVRFYRTVILDEVNRPHVRTAISKGLHPATVLLRHVLRNSLIPVVTNVSLSVPFLFAGSILLESFYGIPGLGGLGFNAVNSSTSRMVPAASSSAPCSTRSRTSSPISPTPGSTPACASPPTR